MPKSQDSVGRRGFLQTAATGAVGIVAGAKPGYAQAQDPTPDHQAVPSDLTLRVKTLESLLVDKGLVALENTAKIHNLVVCTLCSCYPWPLLGLPPVWYKSAPYRSRAVIDPRGVLKEFGVNIDADVEVRVWDSTAEIRYLVLPEQPAGGERLTEAALAALVTRDSMIGTAKVTLDVTAAPA
jgi:hypothetical protein